MSQPDAIQEFTVMNRGSRSIMTPMACVAMVMAGCGRPGKVTGLVTLDGEPLTTGVITFDPAETGPSAYGAIGPDGRYELRTGAAAGLRIGEYVVTVAANAAPTGGAGADDSGLNQPLLPLVTPEKYADRQRTPLRAAVKGGEQSVEFHLTSD